MTLTRDEIVALDKRRVWHPYTAMGAYIDEVDPLVICRGEGSRLFDVDGRAYLDGNASWWVANLGHNHPRLIAALKRQTEELCHCSLAGTTHPGAAQLAEELCGAAPPGLERVFYSDNGSTAVEVAVKLAAQLAAQNGARKRCKFVALDGAFHGDTVGSSSLGGVEVFRKPFAGILFDCVHVPAASEGGYDSAFAALSRALEQGSDEIAAVVLEPRVQGAAGMRMYDPAYLRHARALCTRFEVPLVFDEVFTGYGRTGPMWASETAGVSPDIMCIAKGYSGGMFPMAATLVTEAIFSGFMGDTTRAFLYGHTYCGNPLGAAVAREVLQVYRDERILVEAQGKASAIASAFAGLASLPGVQSTRSLGMIGAADLLDARSGYLGAVGWRVYEAAKRRGLYLRPLGNVVYVTPPLNIPNDDLAEMLGKVREAIEEVVKV